MEQYPEQSIFFNDNKFEILFEIFSVTYGVKILFLPYDLKLTETLTPEWGQESVIGRMDSIATFKRMTRTMNASFKARARYGNKYLNDKLSADSSYQNKEKPYLPVDDLLHTIDHMKKLLYPRYNSEQVMTSPPLFRIKYENLIAAGEETYENGVLCYITSFSANPVLDPNKAIIVNSNNADNFATSKYTDLSKAVYPKIFDINIGFTVLNENLTATQQSPRTGNGTGILSKRYFYNYSTDVGPQGGHTNGSHLLENVLGQGVQDKNASDPSVNEEDIAQQQAALQGT